MGCIEEGNVDGEGLVGVLLEEAVVQSGVLLEKPLVKKGVEARFGVGGGEVDILRLPV